MKDRYDISVDMGDGKDWWYVHGLATHDKVYGVNKQMCDIGKTILTKNKDIMEEKKTKKMTKAEAFEYLKEKKVDASINEREVQLKLFSLGVVWCTLDSKPTLGVGNLFIDKECHMTHCGNDWDYYKTHRYEEISVDDILSIEIIEEKKEPLDNLDDFASKVAKIQETLDDDEVCIITKTNYLTMTK